MFDNRFLTLSVLALAAGLIACSDGDPVTELGALAADQPVLSLGDEGAAIVERGTFTTPFPPPASGLTSVPLAAPCLGLDDVRIGGTWTGWYLLVMNPNGRVHVTEHIDYAGVVVTAGDLTWNAGPGAFETIIQNVPATSDDLGEAAYNIKHEFRARFVSQDGLPDLRIHHRYHALLGPDLQLRRDEFVPFAAECLGTSR